MARILSVEDDPELQHLLALTLQAEGHEMHYAFNGPEGYQKALALNPDLILLDLMLPGCNGAEVLRRLRGHPGAKDLPVLAMTAFRERAGELARELSDLGVLGFVLKPVEVGELVGAVRRALEVRAERTAPDLRLRKGAVRLDPKFRTVWVDGKLAATVGRRRFEVLLELVSAGGAVPRERLLRRVWGAGADINVLEKTVQRLREDLGAEAGRLRTTPGGYELRG